MSWLAGLHLLFRRTEGASPPIAGFLPIGLDVPDAMPRIEVRGEREIALVFDQTPGGTVPEVEGWQPPGVVRNPRMQAASASFRTRSSPEGSGMRGTASAQDPPRKLPHVTPLSTAH